MQGLNIAAGQLSRLTETERSIVVARFGLDGNPAQTMKQIASGRSVSIQAIQQRMEVALGKLRSMGFEQRTALGFGTPLRT